MQKILLYALATICFFTFNMGYFVSTSSGLLNITQNTPIPYHQIIDRLLPPRPHHYYFSLAPGKLPIACPRLLFH